MCTAYEIGKRGGSFPEFVKAKSIAEILGLDTVQLIQPTDPGVVIMPDGELRTMKWGFRRPFKGKLKKTVWRTIVNTREDNLGSGTWREAIAERRCIVPVGLAYEWNGEKGHQRTYGMERPDDGYMWVAGIWEEEEDGLHYSALTTEPNAVMSPYHDRMLAVLRNEEIEPYLAGEMRHFKPACEPIQVRETANPRAGKKAAKEKRPAPEGPVQGELF